MKKLLLACQLFKTPALNFKMIPDKKAKIDLKLPNGCVGIMLAFETEEDLLSFCGSDVEALELEINI